MVGVERVLKQALLRGGNLDERGRGVLEADLAAQVDSMRAAAAADPKLSTLANQYADEVSRAADAFTSDDIEGAIKAFETGFGESDSGIALVCAEHWRPTPNATQQHVVVAACARITQTQAGDGIRAAKLWDDVRNGTAGDPVAAKTQLAELWLSIGDEFGEVDMDLPREDGLEDFRQALILVGGAFYGAADEITKRDGVANAAQRFANNDLASAQRTVDLYCD